MRTKGFHISIPRNLLELLTFYRKSPNSHLLAGGTHLMNHYLNQEEGHHSVLALSQLEELKRISRTDRYAEAGCCVTINRLIDTAYIFNIPLMHETMTDMGPFPIRNMATLGGISVFRVEGWICSLFFNY